MTPVRVELWGVPSRRVPNAFARMGTSRLGLRQAPGLRFAKLFGTASPQTFTPRSTDPRHWGLLTVWDDDASADAFDDSRTNRSWSLIADEVARVRMTPLASTGRWSRREPFGDPQPAPAPHDGPVAAITRARIRPHLMRTFWAASREVAAAVRVADGLVLATGIGEAPVGLQGTFSVWESGAAMSAFAHRDPRHVAAIRRTPEVGWYAEELFARFAVQSVTGRFVGREHRIGGGA